MCLYVSDTVKVTFENGKATLYKVVRIVTERMESLYTHRDIPPGIVHSNRPCRAVTDVERHSHQVQFGIHCFLHAHDAWSILFRSRLSYPAWLPRTLRHH